MSTTIPIHIDIVRSFTEVVVRCLQTTIGVDAVVAATGDAGGAPVRIAVALDFAGDLRGPVTWVFPPAIALELVRRLMDEPDPDPASAPDGATELANILTGRATAALEASGFRCELGVPRMHAGSLPDGITVRMTTDAGPIDLVLSLQRELAA